MLELAIKFLDNYGFDFEPVVTVQDQLRALYFQT
jgi:hypothetical protein